MFDETIKLITQTETTDERGDTVTTETIREIFAQVKSISQTEFYQAQTTGLKPEIKFVIADRYDYQGEKYLKYTPFNGSEEYYTILRTYGPEDDLTLEITASRGINK